MSDELTVDGCLEELRQLFPDTWVSIEVTWRPVVGYFYFIRIYGHPKQLDPMRTLEEAMRRVRAFKQSQAKEQR